MTDEPELKIDTSKTHSYRFIIERVRRQTTITCQLCGCVVKDKKVHALFHHRKVEFPVEGLTLACLGS